MKAKPTHYNGTLFRSRLEADWAKSLDRMVISWRYEPKRIALPSGDWYLPDFFLPEQDSYLEVKGPTIPGIEKLYELEFVETLDDPVLEGRDCHGLFIIGRKFGCFEIINSILPMLIECPDCGRHYFSGYYAPYPPCLFCDRPQHDSYDPKTDSYYKGKPIEHCGETPIPLWQGYRA